MPSVIFTFDIEKNKVKIVLGTGSTFEDKKKFIEVCDNVNARYNPDVECQACVLDQVPEIIDALVNNGFKCFPEEYILIRLAEIAAQIKKDTEATSKRLRKMDSEVKKRTGKTLYPYQRVGSMWLSPRRRALLADQMGVGKTVQAIAALPENCPVIVICPNSVKPTWLKEFKTWRPEFRPFILSGRGSFMYPKPGQVFILNYDIIRGVDPFSPILIKNSGGISPGTRIIVDEIHRGKNIEAKQTQFLRKLRDVVLDYPSKEFKKDWKMVRGSIWGLTGTPMLNRPPELYAVLSNLDLAEEAYGTWRNFTSLFNGASVGWGDWDWGTPKPEAAQLLKRVCLMRKREDVLPDLPTKIYEEITTNLVDKDLQQQLDSIIEELEDVGLQLNKINLDSLQRQQNIFEKLSEIRKNLAVSKIPQMLEIVEDYEANDEPLVVFSHHRAPIEMLENRPGWAAIHGGVSNEKRVKIVEDFQAGKYKGIGLTIGSGSEGITLTHASHMLFVDLSWTPKINEQAEDRICRIGQTRGCIIKWMVCDHPVEQRVHAILIHKEHIISHGVDPAKTNPEDVVSYNMNLDILKTKELQENNTKAFEKFNDILKKNNMLNETKVVSVKNNNDVRGPKNNEEKFNIQALLVFSEIDDSVSESYKINKNDIKIVRTIMNQYVGTKKLSETYWNIISKMVEKYQKQLGKLTKE